MVETKRRWAFVFVNAYGEQTPLNGTEFTARGRAKAEKKLLRRLDKRPGLTKLFCLHPYAFSLEVVSHPQEPTTKTEVAS